MKISPRIFTSPNKFKNWWGTRVKLIRSIVVRANHETQSYRDRSKVPLCPRAMDKHVHLWFAGNFDRGWWIDQAFLCTSWAFLSQSSAHFLIRDAVYNNSRFLRRRVPLPRLYLCWKFLPEPIGCGRRIRTVLQASDAEERRCRGVCGSYGRNARW